MSDAGYFLKITGILALGLLGMVIGLLVMIFLLPHLVFAGLTAVVATLLFLLIWLVVYIGLLIGAVIVYFFKTMDANEVGRQPRKRR